MLQLTKKGLESLFNKICNQNEAAFGEFEYNGIRIYIKKPRLQLGRERSKRLYDARRQEGLCVHCGVKVKAKNPATGKFYRLCDYHRKLELERKKTKRQNKAQKPSQS